MCASQYTSEGSGYHMFCGCHAPPCPLIFFTLSSTFVFNIVANSTNKFQLSTHHLYNNMAHNLHISTSPPSSASLSEDVIQFSIMHLGEGTIHTETHISQQLSHSIHFHLHFLHTKSSDYVWNLVIDSQGNWMGCGLVFSIPY